MKPVHLDSEKPHTKMQESVRSLFDNYSMLTGSQTSKLHSTLDVRLPWFSCAWTLDKHFPRLVSGLSLTPYALVSTRGVEESVW